MKFDLKNLEGVVLKNFVLFSTICFLTLLLFVTSNMMLLFVSCVYLIILTLKLQNYRLSLFLFFIAVLPFTIGKNILEITLLDKSSIYGYSLFNLKYFIPFYLSDAALLLIYQNYISNKFARNEPDIKMKNPRPYGRGIFSLRTSSVLQKPRFLRTEYFVAINRNHAYAALFLFLFILSTFVASSNNIFGNLLIYSSIITFKYLLIFLLPLIVSFYKNKKYIFQVILASVLFQSVLVILEYLKNGNIGGFIESTLPGLGFGTTVSESPDLLRANGTFNEPNIAAIFLLINFCIILPIFLNRIKNNSNTFLYVTMLVVLIILCAMVFTGSRSVLFLTILFIGYIFFSYKPVVKKLFLLVFSKRSFWLLLILIFLFVTPYMLRRIDTLKDIFNPNGVISYRNDLNKHSLELSNNSPIGFGINMTPYYLAKNYKTVASQAVIFDPAPPHNIFIQIIVEEGILGLLLMILFIYFSLREFLISFKISESYVGPYILASIAFLLAAQFHPAFTTHPEILSFFMLYSSIANIQE